MKTKVLRTMLVTLQVVIACMGMCILYVAYVPLALVRVFVDKDGFLDFVDCVGSCVKTMAGWFRKSAK